MPPCSATPCRSGAAKGNFLDLLKADKEVSALLGAAELEGLFDLGYHTKHVDTIFRRVFGADSQTAIKPA